jgi:L-fuculose-phosphate aldolase
MKLMESNSRLVEELCRYSKLCYERGLVGAAGGNLSVRIRGKNLFLVTASGVSLRNMTPNHIIAVDENGLIVEGQSGMRPSKESSFHIAIYRARQSVNAVIHVHPTYATVVSILRKTIPLATISAQLKLKQGTLVPEADPGSKTLANQIIKIVKASGDETSILLLQNHGLVAFHESLDHAFNNAELAEDTARIAYLASSDFIDFVSAFNRIAAVDLSIPLNKKTPFYPTDPPFKKEWHVKFKENGAWVSKLTMGAHSGTHVDAPLHFLEKGSDITMMELGSFFGRARAMDTPKKAGENIEVDDVYKAEFQEGDIVLFRTGWERYAGTNKFFSGEWPGFTPEAVDLLIQKRVKAIGGDIVSADSPSGLEQGAPSHKKALKAGLPVFEALVNLKKVTEKKFLFIGLPLKIINGEASPIRAVALLSKI